MSQPPTVWSTGDQNQEGWRYILCKRNEWSGFEIVLKMNIVSDLKKTCDLKFESCKPIEMIAVPTIYCGVCSVDSVAGTHSSSWYLNSCGYENLSNVIPDWNF